MIAHKLALFALVAVFARGCDSKIVVDKIDSSQTTSDDGVIYSLPNTVARLQVKVDKTTAQGAIYSPFAAIFAPDSEPVCKFEPKIDKATYNKCLEGYVTYSLQQATTFATYGEPDKDQVYLVRFVGKGHIDQSVSMTWTETGLLTAASATVTNRTSDIVLAGLKAVTGLGIKAALGTPADAAALAPPTDCGADSISQDNWVVPVLMGAGVVSGRTLVENYCAIKKTDRKKYPNKTDIAIQFTNDAGTTVRKRLRSC